MVNLDLPLRPWVPQWLGALTLFLIFIPTAMLNGAYTGSMLEVSSSLGVSPASTYEMLYFPMFLRGLGMMILVIAFGVFVVEEIDPKLMLTNAFFVISVRSAFAPVMGVSFYTNALYYLQQRSLTRLSEQLTLADPLAAARYNDTLQQALASGHGMAEAQQLATNTLYGLLQQQSLLLGLKTLLGYLVIATLLLAIVSRFIPFHKTVKVDVVRTGDDMG